MRTLLCLLPLVFLGCPDDEESNDAPDAAVSGVCSEVDCGDGRCVEVDLLPTCDCDDGFTANGLTCVRERLTDAPEDFECPAVTVEGPHLEALTSGAFAIVENDRACDVSGKVLFEFRADGIFVFRDEPRSGGQVVLYGCWSVVEAAADRVTLSYDYGTNTGRNCGWLGDLEDPPCQAVLAYDAMADAIWEIDDEEDNGERFLHRRVDGSLDCTFCSDAEGCCPTPSWRGDSEGDFGCE